MEGAAAAAAGVLPDEEDHHHHQLNCKRVKFEDLREAERDREGYREGERQRESQTETQTVRANAHIHLCFHDPFSLSLSHRETETQTHTCLPFHTFPTYTHQIFDNEEIEICTSLKKDSREEEEKEKEEGEREKDKENRTAQQLDPRNVKIEVHIDTRTWRQAVNIVTGPAHQLQNEVTAATANSLAKFLQEKMIKGVASDATFHSDHHFHFPTSIGDDEIAMQRPTGKLLRRFSIGEDEQGSDVETYETYVCDSQNATAAKLLSRAEKVAMWFIETADSVEFFKDPHWELLCLYQYQPPTDVKAEDYSFIGYITLFTFNTPMVGSRIRVCQALIAPYKQSRGLGREMLRDVYQLARSRPHVMEVTVEDPCPGFQRLRDVVDYEWVVEHSKSNAVEDEDVDSIASRLKIINNQVVFVKEAIEYIKMISTLEGDVAVEDERVEHKAIQSMSSLERLQYLHDKVEMHSNFAAFRLTAKRNLLKEHKDLKYLDKSAMQKELGHLFVSDRMPRYQHVLRAAARLNLLNPNVFTEDYLRKLK